jgi:HEPN domain-containing protein
VTEKALKGFLYSRGEEIALGHSVQRLSERAAVHGPEFDVRGRSWSILDGTYGPTCYPNGLADGIPAEVCTRDGAAEAAAFVTSRLSDGSPSD